MDLRLTSWRGLFKLFAAYSLVAGTAWIVRGGLTTTALGAGATHLALAGVLLAAARYWEPGRHLIDAVAIMLTPWVLWLLAWSEIGWLFEFAPPAYFDLAVARWDLTLFNVHWNERLPQLWAGNVWREFWTGIYLSYYLLILGPPLVLLLRRRHNRFVKHTTGLMLTYLGCFTIYVIMPVLGPRDMALAAGALSASDFSGFFPAIMDAFFRSGDSVGTAFPSSHCAGSTAAALFCYQSFTGRGRLICGLWALLIVISTVHTNNHYAIDALPGIGLAALVYFKEARHETNTRHRRHGVYRPAPGLGAHPAGAQAPRLGS